MQLLAFERFHRNVRNRNRKARELKRLLTSVDVRVPKFGKKCEAGETFAVTTIERLVKQHGQENVILAIRLINETGNGNAGLLRADMLTALTILIARHPDWRDLGLILFETFDKIDLLQLRKLAHLLEVPRYPASAVLIGLIAADVQRILGDLA